MAKITASDLAKYVIDLHVRKQAVITNLKLQKLLYYAQGWYLAFNGEPLFNDRIEAWVHGPVVPGVFREYREFRWSPLTAAAAYAPSDEVASHVSKVLGAYGKFDASQLELMTHNEEPWRAARHGLAGDASSNREITIEAMRAFFASRVNG